MATELGAAKRYDPNTDSWVPIMIGAQGVGVPEGGTSGQALVKQSGTNYDTAWQDQEVVDDAASISFSDSGLAVVTGVSDVQAALGLVDAALDDRPTQQEIEDSLDARGLRHYEERTVTSGSSETFTLPSGLRRVEFGWNGRATGFTGAQRLGMRVNGDFGSNYSRAHKLEGSGGVVDAVYETTSDRWTIGAMPQDNATRESMFDGVITVGPQRMSMSGHGLTIRGTGSSDVMLSRSGGTYREFDQDLSSITMLFTGGPTFANVRFYIIGYSAA